MCYCCPLRYAACLCRLLSVLGMCAPQVLHVLQRRVVSAKAAVPAAVQAELFSDAALQQLASIATSAAVEGQEEEVAEEQGAAGEGGEQEARQAAAAALAILEALATQPAHGLAACWDGC